MAKDSKTLRLLRAALLAWYSANKRDLPWRRTRDPYRIWVSEIMLQQTRVAAVLEHYRKFLEAFPTVEALAGAPIESVLAVWSGLGYYRRARGLHAAAQAIVEEFACALPASSAELRQLPGVGRYTAAAVASIAFGERTAVVDGNVERVLARLDGKQHRGEALWARAGEVLSPEQPGDWNEAMMELGATVCTPLAPRCAECPLKKWCVQRGRGERAPKQVRQRSELAYALQVSGESVRLVQRTEDASLMAGMWELPELTAEPEDEPLLRLRHSITNTEYTVRVYRVAAKSGRWFKRERISELPLTGLARKVLRKVNLL